MNRAELEARFLECAHDLRPMLWRLAGGYTHAARPRAHSHPSREVRDTLRPEREALARELAEWTSGSPTEA